MVKDLDEEELEDHMKQSSLYDMVLDHSFISAERVSAKTGENVNDAFGKIVREVLMRVYYNEGGKKKGENPRDKDLHKSVLDYQN